MTIGHQFLLNTFQVIPSIGWQIDPFGHSSSQASLFSQMGFNAWFFARIDYQDKAKRLKEKSLEMIMHPIQVAWPRLRTGASAFPPSFSSSPHPHAPA